MLTLTNVLESLEQTIVAALPRQITDPAHPDYGGIIRPEWGLADPSHVTTTPFIAGCAYLYLDQAEARRHVPSIAPADLLARATMAIEYLLRVQRPSGLIDLRDCNYDSSPDTGFAVQSLCAVIELGRPLAPRDSAWANFLGKVERFVRLAVPGLLTGGFHTPNHRWVIASALAQAGALFPDLPVRSVIEAYLAEGFDIDADGAYIERSSGIYDSVCDRSLLLLADHWDCPAARPTVAANLNFNLHLFHADGTMETGLSHRQDYGTAIVPLGLAAAYLHYASVVPNPVFARTAQWLWDKASARGVGAEVWMTYVMFKFGEPAQTSAPLPENFARFFSHNGIWRVRRDALSASFFRGVTRLMTLRFGQAELSSVKISANYFGTAGGWFIGDALDVQGDTATFRSEGLGRPRRPGYEQPLGRPVPPDQYEAMIPQRALRTLPPLTSTLIARETTQGFDFRYQTLDGLDRVVSQIAFDFPPGGIWETQDSCLKPHAGQIIFLKQGFGAMRYGDDVIRIEPGAVAHRIWNMRDAEPAPQHVRVLMTFVTPIDHAFSIRVSRGHT
ncbi:MAG: hypothetical protein HY868_11130 [Chloroflexi bacterium]|nr:hypothetical protein [Chloroflexota bacterium]